MKKIAIALLLLASAAFCFGQAPGPAVSPLGSGSDVYVGFLATSPDYGAAGSGGSQFFALPIYGGEIAYTKNLNSRWGITAAAAISGESTWNLKEFTGTVGPRYNVLTGRLRPYITAQIGYVYQSSGLYGTINNHPLGPGQTASESGFAYRLGAGADLQLTRRIYWRIIQYDIQPQPWGPPTPWYQNFGGGIGFRL